MVWVNSGGKEASLMLADRNTHRRNEIDVDVDDDVDIDVDVDVDVRPVKCKSVCRY